MTIGPDIADAEGNLTPEAARELMDAPPPEAAPLAAPRMHEVRQAAGRQGRAAAVPPAIAPVHRHVRLGTPFHVLAFVAALAGLIGFTIGRKQEAHPIPVTNQAGVMPSGSAETASGIALVNGTNVNLRSGPGLGFPTIARLLPGEGLQVRSEQRGWYAVTTSTGVSGWVFGAFLRGHGSPDRGAAVVMQMLASNGAEPRVIVRRGEKVFFTREADGSVVIVLPTGRELRVSPEVLTCVE